MTPWPELTSHQINESLFTAGNPTMCLRHLRRHRDPVRPSSVLQIEHINHAENSIDRLVASDDEKLVADLRRVRFRPPLRTTRTHSPHQFRRLAMQAIEFHLFAYLCRDPLRQYSTKDFFEDTFFHPFTAV
jgi:hypothetical protein